MNVSLQIDQWFMYSRMKVQKCVNEQLLDLNLSKDWKYHGRPCSPRVLFVFEMSSLDFDPDELVESAGYKSKPVSRENVQPMLASVVFLYESSCFY